MYPVAAAKPDGFFGAAATEGETSPAVDVVLYRIVVGTRTAFFNRGTLVRDARSPLPSANRSSATTTALDAQSGCEPLCCRGTPYV